MAPAAALATWLLFHLLSAGVEAQTGVCTRIESHEAPKTYTAYKTNKIIYCSDDDCIGYVKASYKVHSTYLVYWVKKYCCPGYERNPDTHACDPVCPGGCGSGGQCSQPYSCTCQPGYIQANGTCMSPCEVRGCQHGSCTDLTTCTCDAGYEKPPDEAEDESKPVECRPVCRFGCVNADCVAPDTCRCLPGYSGYGPLPSHRGSPLEASYQLRPKAPYRNTCWPVCRRGCQNAYCALPETCHCLDGYRKNRRLFACDPVCTEPCRNGDCTKPDFCTCWDSYQKDPEDAKNSTCNPICSTPCTNADCTEPDICTCFDGYEVDLEDLSGSTCLPVCSNQCTNANCTEPETCTCFDGYELDPEDPSNSTCLPVCSPPCVNAHCTEPEVCTCWDGYEADPDDPSNSRCAPVCPDGCTNADCSAPSTCTCLDGYEMDLADERNSTCLPVCSNGCVNGNCTEPEVCSCFSGFGMLPWDATKSICYNTVQLTWIIGGGAVAAALVILISTASIAVCCSLRRKRSYVVQGDGGVFMNPSFDVFEPAPTIEDLLDDLRKEEIEEHIKHQSLRQSYDGRPVFLYN